MRESEAVKGARGIHITVISPLVIRSRNPGALRSASTQSRCGPQRHGPAAAAEQRLMAVVKRAQVARATGNGGPPHRAMRAHGACMQEGT